MAGGRNKSGAQKLYCIFLPLLPSTMNTLWPDKQQRVGEAASDKDYAETPHTVILPHSLGTVFQFDAKCNV